MQALGVDPLMDDRDGRPGVKFADMELIGIPHRIVVGERALADGEVEYRGRTDTDSIRIKLDALPQFLAELGLTTT